MNERTHLLLAREHGIDYQTAWIILKCQMGSGILALPFAIARGGWFSVLVLLFVGASSWFSMTLICQLLFEDGRIVRTTVYEIAETVFFTPTMRTFSMVMQLLDVFGALVTYVVLGGTLISSLCGLSPFVGTFIFGIAANSLPFLLPSTEKLAKISIVGNLNVAFIYIVIFIQATFSIPSWGEYVIELPLITYEMLIAFGICLFTFACHVSVPVYVAKMNNPLQWRKTLNLGFGCGVLMQTSFAILGFLAFGLQVQQAANLDITVHFVQVLVIIAVTFDKFFSFPLLFEVTHTQASKVFTWASKPVLSAIIIVLSLSIPHFAYVSAISGALACSFNLFIFPAIWTLTLRNPSFKIRCILYSLIMIGIVGGILGTGTTLFKLI